MIVKMLKADGLSFALLDAVSECGFVCGDEGCEVKLTFADGSTSRQPVEGQVFVMSDTGYTVERFDPRRRQKK